MPPAAWLCSHPLTLPAISSISDITWVVPFSVSAFVGGWGEVWVPDQIQGSTYAWQNPATEI